MNLIDKDALIESLGIETDCDECEHGRNKYYCNLDPTEVCAEITEAPVITVTTESAEKAIEVLKNAAWLGAVYSFEETEEAVKTAIRALQVTSAQPETNCSEFPNNSDTISRQAAIDALGEEPPVWYDGEDEIAERNQWRRDVKAIKAVPSAQAEPEPVGCYGCRYERFGNRVCDVCSRLYADRYSAERRTDGTEDTD